MLNALIIAPHPDDAELGMGGTIVRLIQHGWKVGILDLTSGEPTPLGTLERRAAETAASNATLGNPWRKNLDLPNRCLEPTLLHRRAVAAVFRKVRQRLFSRRTGKMLTRITPPRPNWLRMLDSGASSPEQTLPAIRFIRPVSSTISVFICESSSGPSSSSIFPSSSKPSWRP